MIFIEKRKRKRKAHVFILRHAYISTSNSVFCFFNLGAWEFPKLKDRKNQEVEGGREWDADQWMKNRDTITHHGNTLSGEVLL